MSQENVKPLAVVGQVPTLIDFQDPKIIQTIKATVAKGCSDSQLALFIQVCTATGLNPFLREIWLIPKTNTIMASRDGYLRKANESPQFDGMETRVEREKNADGIEYTIIKAVCTVWRKDRGHPITCEAYFNEYTKDATVWRQYPSAMISKVAEVLALKRSFAINGVVTEEEIGSSGGQPEAGEITVPPLHKEPTKPVPSLPPPKQEEAKVLPEFEIVRLRAKFINLLNDTMEALPNKTQNELAGKALGFNDWRMEELPDQDMRTLNDGIAKLEGYLKK